MSLALVSVENNKLCIACKFYEWFIEILCRTFVGIQKSQESGKFPRDFPMCKIWCPKTPTEFKSILSGILFRTKLMVIHLFANSAKRHKVGESCFHRLWTFVRRKTIIFHIYSKNLKNSLHLWMLLECMVYLHSHEWLLLVEFPSKLLLLNICVTQSVADSNWIGTAHHKIYHIDFWPSRHIGKMFQAIRMTIKRALMGKSA